jgi:hypothetical protein
VRPPIGTIVLLILAAVLYAATMGSLSDAPHSDAAGRGMAVAFGALFATVLFVAIAALLVVAAVKGEMSLAGRIGAVVLMPAAVVAIWFAADAYGAGDLSAIWVAALLPPLFVAYALRARFAVLRRQVPGWIADIVVVLACAVLIGLPLARQAFPPPRDPAAEARAAAEEQARVDREEQAAREARQREDARFAALGPDSSIADYLEFLHGDRSREAREGIARVRSRQSDAVALLKDGRLRDLAGLLEWDLDATPEICAAYGAALAKQAARIDPKVDSNYLGIAIDLEAQRPNLEWLTSERCDLDGPLALLEGNLRAVADSTRITKFADQLKRLRSR